MAKVYVLSHGHTCIAHRFGAASFDNRQIKAIYDSEEKVIGHIRQNVGYRVELLSSQDRFDEYPVIENFKECTKLIYAMTADYNETEFQYYIYETYDVQ